MKWLVKNLWPSKKTEIRTDQPSSTFEDDMKRRSVIPQTARPITQASKIRSNAFSFFDELAINHAKPVSIDTPSEDILRDEEEEMHETKADEFLEVLPSHQAQPIHIDPLDDDVVYEDDHNMPSQPAQLKPQPSKPSPSYTIRPLKIMPPNEDIIFGDGFGKC